MVNASPEERAAALVAEADGPVLVLDRERRLVAASPAAATLLGDARAGRRVTEEQVASMGAPLVLFLSAVPELSAYEELRAGFTAAVSHELRTPLARLLALLETATLPGADLERLVEQAVEEVLQVRELIDDVLFLGELETGSEVVALGRTRVRPVVDEVLAALGGRAADAQVRLVQRVGDGVALPLRPRMLRVVVENLVENAIRYAGPGATCTISVTAEGRGPALVVSDDGKGVAPADLPRLFERFYRADQARSSRGTGLGLAIVKHIVTAAGGAVEARGGPGRGLAVVARFPG